MRLRLGVGVMAVAVIAASGASGGSGENEAAGVRVTEGAQTRAGIVASGKSNQGLAAYGALPLSFVPNAGQLDRYVRYSAQAAGVSFFFTRKEAVFSLARNKKSNLALRLRFVDANPNVVISGHGRQLGRINYLRGNDPAKWRTNVPTYGEVFYHDLWPGIDLVFRGVHGQLKYELHVAPGASIDRVRFAYAGASGLSLDPIGNLRIRTSLGTITDSRPVSYEQLDGRRIPVMSRFLLALAGGAYGFAVEGYEHSRSLVIDPGLAYSTYLGSGRDEPDQGLGIAVDAKGSAYVTGATDSKSFPAGGGGFDTSFNYNGDAFVTKLNPDGSGLVWSTYLGGGLADGGWDIALDRAGSVYIVGGTSSPDFPTTPLAFDRTTGDLFVTKLNSAGSALVYSTHLGADLGSEERARIAVDSNGSAYVGGTTNSTAFPTTPRGFDRTFSDSRDAFVTKLNASGTALAYSTFLGGKYTDEGNDIAVDGAGRAYVIGYTESPDFPTTAGALDRSLNNIGDAFVTRLDADGSGLSYSTYLGGSGTDNGTAIAVDSKGRAFVAGSFGVPTTRGALGDKRGSTVTKLNEAGSALIYSASPVNGLSLVLSLAIDREGNAYLTGRTGGNLPTTPGSYDRTVNIGRQLPMDAFVAKMNAAGSALDYSTYLGGTSMDDGAAIAVDAKGSAYVTGDTYSIDFPTTKKAFQRAFGGSDDAFVTKIDIPQRCVVPAVVGMRLARASAEIRQAGCSVGDVRQESSKDVGLVIEQRPRAGTTGARGMKVNLVVGRR